MVTLTVVLHQVEVDGDALGRAACGLLYLLEHAVEFIGREWGGAPDQAVHVPHAAAVDVHCPKAAAHRHRREQHAETLAGPLDVGALLVVRAEGD